MSHFKKTKNIISLVLFLSTVGFSHAQNQLSSPYSRFGLGELSKRTSLSSVSMGGIAYAYQSATAVNFSNPAAYVGYDSISALIDAAFSYKYHQLQDNRTKQQGGTIEFDYLALGLSLAKNWTTSFGFQPYSFINYTINETSAWNDSVSVNTAFKGRGGIYEFYWGNAFKVFKNFSLGCNISYLFGNYDKIRTAEFSDDLFLNFKGNDKTSMKGALFSFGTQYFIPVKKSTIGIGAVYTPSIPTVFATQSEVLSHYRNTSIGEEIIDTLYWNGVEKNKVKLPQTVGVGLSWSSEKYFIGFDFTWSDWEKAKIGNNTDTLKNSYKYALGGNVIPNPTGSKYISKIQYSLGAFYELTPVYLKEKQVDRFGINFGMSFPMKKSKTRISMIVEYGKWGINNTVLQENYVKCSFNLALHERWYQRRKLE
ncbi:MAG: hypothetical protein ACOXZH_03555 [Bacteroidales bacterium]|jgi:hypothetical protein|nr:hypothetical protein [Bacteroidales bacterium]